MADDFKAPPTPKQLKQNYYVLFADLLGFKNIVLNNRTPKAEHLDFRDPPFWGNFRGGTLADPIRLAEDNPLSKAFIAFHGGIEITRRDMHWGKGVSLLVFSDSVFLATESVAECFGFAERLMLYCLGQEAPIRMGVGYGGFVTYGFSFEETPQLKYISSQFLGSGVIHATETEKCVRGLRIGVHDSVATRVQDKDFAAYRLLPLPEDELQPGVGYEWNYFGGWSSNPYLRDYPHFDAGQIKAIRDHLTKMREAAPKDDRVQDKYARTDEAIRRMGMSIASAEENPRFQPPPPFELDSDEQ